MIAFTYNPDGTVKKVTVKSEAITGDDLVDYSVTYNASKKIESLVSTTGDKIVPVYENEILKRADLFTGPERTGYTNYSYENGLLKRATIYFGSGTNYEPFLEYNFSYNAAGNLSENVVMMTDGVPGHMVRAGHVTFQYDQKTNPLHTHRDLLNLFWLSSSKNNITREDHFDSNLQLEDQYVYTYTYKANGLPEKAQVKVGLPGQPPDHLGNRGGFFLEANGQ